MSTTTAARRAKRAQVIAGPQQLRVAVYARKSTEKGMEQQFNSIDAQIEACRAYHASQQALGWVALPEPYSDAGFSGSTLQRPAMSRLLADVASGRIDIVLAYRMDRLSRRQLDLLNVFDLFERHGVRFISVTEPFTAATPMGRAMISLMGVFAQMERETIAERIGDKMSAARRLGIWQGGRPPLGLDVVEKKLVVNPDEAAIVRDIFDTYLRLQSIAGTLAELSRRGIRNKSWTTKRGHRTEGSAFDVNSLRTLLRNPLLAGRMHAGDEVVPAGHEAVVLAETFNAVQALLNARRPETRAFKPSGALLQGLLRCARCGAPMTPHYTSKGTRRFGYYVCSTQKRKGTAVCPGTRAPSGELETFVVERIRAIGRDPRLVAEAVAATRAEIDTRRDELAQDVGRLDVDARRLRAEHDRLVDTVAATGGQVPALVERLTAATTDTEATEARVRDARADLAALDARQIDEADLTAALASFTPVWDELFPHERSRILHLLLDAVVYDADTDEVRITFRAGGVRELAGEAAP